MNHHCEGIGYLREAIAHFKDLMQTEGSRELALVITKAEEAMLWRLRDMQLKTPEVNEDNSSQ